MQKAKCKMPSDNRNVFFILNFSYARLFLFLSINRSMDGSTIKSNGNAIMKPPITAIASGWCNCAPVPIPRANGISAMIAPRAVISFGRSLVEME